MQRRKEQEQNPVSTMDEGLSIGIYRIMRKIPSYKVADFFDDSFMASRFFALIDLIQFEEQQEKEAYEKAQKEKE